MVAWEPDPVNVSADDALAGERDEHGGRTERDDAAGWLRDFLSDGPKLARDVLTESKAAGFAKRTIDRAKPVAGVRTRKEAFGGGWVWELRGPDEERHGDPEERHTPDVGNLGAKPDESREFPAKVATPDRVATLGGPGGNLRATDAGDGWGEV